jgi:hypothetical protein
MFVSLTERIFVGGLVLLVSSIPLIRRLCVALLLLPTVNGNGFTIDGQGAKYWDGDGTSSPKQAKPHPMIKYAIQ